MIPSKIKIESFAKRTMPYGHARRKRVKVQNRQCFYIKDVSHFLLQSTLLDKAS